MDRLAGGVSYCDLVFQGVPRIIAAAVLHGPGGVAIVDPGPSTTLPALRAALAAAGLSMSEVTALLLTHIHLDHAGAAGTLVREHPHIKVYVHSSGARHLIDPQKLIASATRLYGSEMESLWGEVAPVAPEAIVALDGGERMEAAGRTLQVEHTPGHASHHVSYFSADTGIAFVGDTAGVRLRPGGYVLPPTPPPDIDLEAWEKSLARIAAWGPDTLFVTHFGPHAPCGAHLSELREHLDLVARLAKASLAREDSDQGREAWFADQLRLELRRHAEPDDVQAYEIAGRFDLSWAGLARYCRKRSG